MFSFLHYKPPGYRKLIDRTYDVQYMSHVPYVSMSLETEAKNIFYSVLLKFTLKWTLCTISQTDYSFGNMLYIYFLVIYLALV